MSDTKNIVIFGLTGSGKDTISDFLVREYNYFKIRIAGTIKQIIQERRNLSIEELELQKRIDPEVREEHHTVGNYLGDATINRIKLIISGGVTEFQYKDSNQDIVVCDGRGLEREIKLFLESPDWVCIFLSRDNYDVEHKSATSHWTDNSDFNKALKFIEENEYYDRSIIIMNNKGNASLDEEYDKIAKKCLFYTNISGKASTAAMLLKTIQHLYDNNYI